jgi:drug/metabolite transporter (DMT)-like permease
MGSVEIVRRLGTVDLMLFAVVVIWAFNLTVTKYVLAHGFRPLSYVAIRYGAAALVFAGLTLALEGTLRVGGRGSLLILGAAILALFLNQFCFIYALKLASATTVALILGTTPIFTALLSHALGLERVTPPFWLAAVVSFAGVALVALGSGGSFSANVKGELLAVGMAGTWSAYSVAIAPLLRTYSPYRISSIVLLVMWVPLIAVSAPQLTAQDYGRLGTLDWLGLAYAIFGPLVLTNVLFFSAIDRVGPSHATLFTNLQPFVAAIFAIAILSEKLTRLEIAGGFAIACGILLSRRTTALVPVE